MSHTIPGEPDEEKNLFSFQFHLLDNRKKKLLEERTSKNVIKTTETVFFFKREKTQQLFCSVKLDGIVQFKEFQFFFSLSITGHTLKNAS